MPLHTEFDAEILAASIQRGKEAWFAICDDGVEKANDILNYMDAQAAIRRELFG
jgi:hypothetical protein